MGRPEKDVECSLSLSAVFPRDRVSHRAWNLLFSSKTGLDSRSQQSSRSLAPPHLALRWVLEMWLRPSYVCCKCSSWATTHCTPSALFSEVGSLPEPELDGPASLRNPLVSARQAGSYRQPLLCPSFPMDAGDINSVLL